MANTKSFWYDPILTLLNSKFFKARNSDTYYINKSGRLFHVAADDIHPGKTYWKISSKNTFKDDNITCSFTDEWDTLTFHATDGLHGDVKWCAFCYVPGTEVSHQPKCTLKVHASLCELRARVECINAGQDPDKWIHPMDKEVHETERRKAWLIKQEEEDVIQHSKWKSDQYFVANDVDVNLDLISGRDRKEDPLDGSMDEWKNFDANFYGHGEEDEWTPQEDRGGKTTQVHVLRSVPEEVAKPKKTNPWLMFLVFNSHRFTQQQFILLYGLLRTSCSSNKTDSIEHSNND